jgi:septal ring factor EnvC (AmiA/AmiB activator)
MKKLFAMTLLGIGMFAGTSAFAQTTTATSPNTQQVIASIPALQSIAQEIAAFEAKTEGNKENFQHANEDLKALKMKYAAELKTQIALNQDKPEVLAVLTAELAKTEKEIEQLNTPKNHE